MDIHHHIGTLYQQLLDFVPQLILGVVVFLLFWLAALIVKSFVIRLANHSKRRKYLLRLLGQASKVAIILIGLVSGLGTMGINVTALVTGLGLVGFALGFALKDSLSNIIAGFMIIFYHPFQVNDFISVSTINGTVVDINLRYTTIHTDTETHVVPNSTLISSIVTIQNPNTAS